MPQCPKCGAQIEADFGVVDCPSCHSVLFIDMNGNAIIQEQEEMSANADSIANEVVVDAFTEPMEPTEDPVAQNEEFQQETISDEENAISAIENEQPVYEEITQPLNSAVAVSSDMSEIASFANSEQSNVDTGNLVYTVFIQGIDDSTLHQQVVEALTDSRFKWDVEELSKSISSGQLTISNINPVKASILVSRLKALPITIAWRQYALTQVGP